MAKTRKDVVGTSYAARVLGVSEVRVRQLVGAGKLRVKHKTLDGRRFFDPAEIERLRRAREVKKRLEQQREAQV